MKLSLIVKALRAWAPGFGQRVLSAPQFKPIPENQHLDVPAAYVMPWEDAPDGKDNASPGGYRQTVSDGFSVLVVVDNRAGEYSPAAADQVHDLRAEIWAALLGWEPSDDYDEIVYQGGGIEYVDRARLYYRLDFSARTEIEVGQTRHAAVIAALPALEVVGISLDAIDPADPNRAAIGPDGRIEAAAEIIVPQD